MKGDQKRVLVVGATGYVGRHIVARLHEDGYRVRAVVRDEERALAPGAYGAPALAERVDEWVVARGGRADVDAAVMSDVDHVVSALGVTRQKADPWEIDFLLNLRYLELAEEERVDSFLYVGVMNAATGTSMVSRSKHAFMEALRRADVGPQIVNPSGYFSDLTEIFDLARRGMAFGLGDGHVRLSPIHGADLAEFCVSRLRAGAGTWDVGGPEALSYREIVQMAFDAAGRKPRYVRVPGALASSAVWAADRLSPRAGSLTRFFLEGMQTDSVGVPFGTRTLRDYFASLSDQLQRSAERGGRSRTAP
ncbi:NAD(P)H-binding protein [Saccharopolyspora indica]|uniref:SDR family oxidoreductase n=1 Tax=Saccharopolyspora indica TaxID=1229659 RepID=UPI0022EB0508|nr:NAD(P)H-binding protein [Saccharopolyspora indica]MDA3643412.1 NAD(P)H-binding protein [Saccharopolyspora indica]